MALKILPAEVSGDPARRLRFEQEARAVAALSHPNIVAIYDVGEENGVHFIVTELVDGDPLREMNLGLRKALDCAVQIAGGLGAAHAAGITHRDLKRGNILLTPEGRVKDSGFQRGVALFDIFTGVPECRRSTETLFPASHSANSLTCDPGEIRTGVPESCQ